MRYPVAVVLVALFPTLPAQHDPRLYEYVQDKLHPDEPVRVDRCASTNAVPSLAARIDIPIGFENLSDCWLTSWWPGPTDGVGSLTGPSVRQALDELMTRLPNYSWREVGGVAVIRPRDAWNDPANVLNLPTRAFQAADVPLDEVLNMALRASVPGAFYPYENLVREHPINRPITVSFHGGTLLEAINAIVRAHQNAEWQLGYGSGRATIVLSTLDFGGGVVMAPVAVPQRQR